MELAAKLAEFVLRCGQTAYTEPPAHLAFHTKNSIKVFDRVQRSISPEKRISVLDVGCADGFALKIFRDAAFKKYMGVTSNIGDVDELRYGQPGYASFRQSDMHRIALWPSGNYSLVWARHVLEHSPIPLFMLEALRNQMDPDGYLYVEVPSATTVSEHAMNPNHYSCFGREAWQGLFYKAGLPVVIDSFDFDVDLDIGKDTYFCWLLKSLSRQNVPTDMRAAVSQQVECVCVA